MTGGYAERSGPPGGLTVARLAEEEWAAYRVVRLEMLTESPGAFGSTLSQAQLFGEEHWRERLSGNGVYLARLGGRPVGSATYTEHGVSQPGDAQLVAMWVEPGARGRGVGSALVRAVQEHARVTGRRRLLLAVVDDNQAAAGLYRSCGFVATGRTNEYPNDPLRHEVEMVWSPVEVTATAAAAEVAAAAEAATAAGSTSPPLGQE